MFLLVNEFRDERRLIDSSNDDDDDDEVAVVLLVVVVTTNINDKQYTIRKRNIQSFYTMKK